MAIEAQSSPGQVPSEQELLERFLLVKLEANDGLCLDNQLERVILAAAMTHALVSAAKDGTIDFVRVLEPLQTGEKPASLALGKKP